MKAIEAAAIVLNDADGPLHYRELTDRMLARKLWTTEGRTPWDTVRARGLPRRSTSAARPRVSFVLAPGCSR